MSYTSSDTYTHEMWRMDHDYSSKGCPCGHCKKERKEIAVRRQSTDLQTVADAAGLNILPSGTRVGNTQRDLILQHIDEMEQGGFIDAEEADKRRGYVENAKTSAELNALTIDLPAPMDHRPRLIRTFGKYDFDKPSYYAPTLLLAILFFVTLAVMPTAIAGNDQWFSTVHGLWECISSITVGVAGAVSCFVWLISKIVDDD